MHPSLQQTDVPSFLRPQLRQGRESLPWTRHGSLQQTDVPSFLRPQLRQGHRESLTMDTTRRFPSFRLLASIIGSVCNAKVSIVHGGYEFRLPRQVFLTVFPHCKVTLMYRRKSVVHSEYRRWYTVWIFSSGTARERYCSVLISGGGIFVVNSFPRVALRHLCALRLCCGSDTCGFQVTHVLDI